MKNKYAERLEKMIEILSQIRRRKIQIDGVAAKFSLNTWKEESEDCGTIMCACGYAASHPWFTKRGFKLARGHEKGMITNDLVPIYGDQKNWEAVMKFFGLTLREASELFDRYYYEKENPAPRDVITRIRKHIRSKSLASA